MKTSVLNMAAWLSVAGGLGWGQQSASYLTRPRTLSAYAQAQKQSYADAKRQRKNAIRLKNHTKCVANNGALHAKTN